MKIIYMPVKKDFKKEKNKLENAIARNTFKYPIKVGNNKIIFDTDSWFDIIETENRINKSYKSNYNSPKKNSKMTKCIKIVLKFTPEQDKIIKEWLKGNTLMYNQTIKYIKDVQFKTGKLKLNWMNIRKGLYNEKNKIGKNYNVPIHILDQTIKRTTSMIKTSLTNLKKGNIKYFRIRYIKNKIVNVLGIEKGLFSKQFNTFCKRFLGKNIDSNDFDLKSVRNCGDSTLYYNENKNSFQLLVPVKIKQKSCKNKKKICSIDAGLRTFLTCLSEDNIMEIGTNLIKTINGSLKRKDKIMGLKAPNRIKKRYEKIINEKIKNRINDLHWKTINYLTNKFGVIVIGKWSTKDISLNNKSKLAPILKRIASHLSFHKFIEKLKYKCESKMIDLRHIDESYTSKLCSECMFYNYNLKKSKHFKCIICKLDLDRDVNSAKNIMLKGVF